MQKNRKLKARILSLAMSAMLVAATIPAPVFAAREGGTLPDADAPGVIVSFDKLEDRFEPSTGEDAPAHIYGLEVELDTPFEELELPTELTAMVSRTSVEEAPSEEPKEAEPTEVEPTEVEPTEVEPTEVEPTEVEPTEAETAEAEPTEAEPTEAEPTETEPTEAEPTEAEDEITASTENADDSSIISAFGKTAGDFALASEETIPVTWTGNKEYKSDENGKFIYTAKLPEEYILADGVKLPQIYVMVGRQVRTSQPSFLIKATDMNGVERTDIKVPEGVKIWVLYDDGTALDPDLYQIDWCYTVEGVTEIYKEDSSVLEIPATTTYMLDFGLFPVIKNRGTGETVEELPVPTGFLHEPETSYLVIENTPVFPGEEHSGVSFSNDGKTVTLDNVTINYEDRDFWGTAPVFVNLVSEDSEVLVKGENAIVSKRTTAMEIVSNHLQWVDKSLCTMEGTSEGSNLSLYSNAGNALMAGSGHSENTGPSTDLTIRGLTLNLSAQSEDASAPLTGAALHLSKGTLRIEDGTINTIGDSTSVIELNTESSGDDDSGMEVLNSQLYILSNAPTMRQADESRVIPLFVGGENALLLDNSELAIMLRTRTAERVIGYAAMNGTEPTIIKNGSKVSVLLKDPEESDDTVNVLTAGLVAGGFDIQNSEVMIDVEGSDNGDAVVWGIAYGFGKFNTSNDSITIDTYGQFAEGIRYYDDYDNGQAGQFDDLFPSAEKDLKDAGTVNISDSKVTLNAISSVPTISGINPVGLSGRFLNIGFSNENQGLEIETSSATNSSIAIALTKSTGADNIGYTSGYQPERIKLNANTKIISPVEAEINMFSHSDDSGAYLQNEVIYGADKTTPVGGAKIGFFTTPPKKGGGSSSDRQAIWTSVPTAYKGGTKLIGNVRVPDYTVEGTWKKNENGTWSFSGKEGQAYVNSWAPIFNPYADVTKGQSAFDWFKFDASGNMIIGWHTDADGNTYYLNPNSDNTQGAMKTGWVLIDGKYYYFNEMSDGTRGKLFKTARTPDGYFVDENGVRIGTDKQ